MATKISRKTLISLAAAGASVGIVEPVRGLAGTRPPPTPTDWPVINSSTAVFSAVKSLETDARNFAKKGHRAPKIVANWAEVEAFLRYMADEIEHYRYTNPAEFVEPPPPGIKHKRPSDEPPN